jgi:hypothetical protein
MSRRQLVEQERRLAAELSAKFRGTASIKLKVLDFPFKKQRKEDKKNTKRLKKMFQKEKHYRD